MQNSGNAFARYLGSSASLIASSGLLLFLANRIDFHADEAIYLSRVPLNLKNDSGLFFNAWYWIGSFGTPTPYSARILSGVLGVILVVSTIIAFCAWLPEKKRWILASLPILIVCSYQGIFLSLRVRPELSWICIAAMIVSALSMAGTARGSSYQNLALLLITLLPMNHRLSWLACIFVGGYLVLFGFQAWGTRFTLIALGCLPLGVAINLCARPLILGESLQQAIAEFTSAPEAPPRMWFPKFLHNVFWECSSAFRDTAAYPSWWDRSLPTSWKETVNHHAFANWLWCLGCFLPMFAKSWKQLYVLAVPVMALLLMYIAGYFNPTYFASLSLFSLIGFTFVFFRSKGFGIEKSFATICIAISFLNGASFVSTRVANHGRASMFAIEAQLRSFVNSIPATASIAVPERFQSIAMYHRGPRFVIYKDTIPNEVDFVVVDDYDFEMYKPFIQDFAAKKTQIDTFLDQFETLASGTFQVYWRDRLFPQLVDGQIRSMQGSWFFRHSVQYRITVLVNKATLNGYRPHFAF